MPDRNDKLKTCPHCGGSKYRRNFITGGLMTCPTCDGRGEIEEKKQTNFDRITESPEKLAEFIQDAMAYCKHCKADCATACGYYQQHEIVPCAGDGLVDWLKRESDSK